jgi:hypothetical protein
VRAGPLYPFEPPPIADAAPFALLERDPPALELLRVVVRTLVSPSGAVVTVRVPVYAAPTADALATAPLRQRERHRPRDPLDVQRLRAKARARSA